MITAMRRSPQRLRTPARPTPPLLSSCTPLFASRADHDCASPRGCARARIIHLHQDAYHCKCTDGAHTSGVTACMRLTRCRPPMLVSSSGASFREHCTLRHSRGPQSGTRPPRHQTTARQPDPPWKLALPTASRSQEEEDPRHQVNEQLGEVHEHVLGWMKGKPAIQGWADTQRSSSGVCSCTQAPVHGRSGGLCNLVDLHCNLAWAV